MKQKINADEAPVQKQPEQVEEAVVPPVQHTPDEALLAQVEEWKTKYLRALADYQNLEKRTREQIEETRKYAAELLLARFLPVLDTFEKAYAHVQDPGLALALKEFYAVLSEKGAERITTVGKAFDPHEMECIEVVAGKEGMVMEEVVAGYRLYGKVLRVAGVKVGKENV